VISVLERRYREGQPPTIYGDGRQTRDFVSVHDVARANVLAATAPNLRSGSANICTGRSTSLLEVLAAFRERHPDVAPPVHVPARPGDVVHSLGAPDEATRALGFVAEVKVKTGLQELFALK
jgi:UDP-glucose 4-epimerase